MMSSPPRLPRLKIVVAAPDPSLRQFLKQVLQDECHHQIVGEATTGASLVRQVLAAEPDLVLFEVRLPSLTGLEALRSIQETRPVAAVALTPDRNLDVIRQAVEAHVEAFLTEPIAGHHLEPALQIAWSCFQARQHLLEENAEIRQALENRKIVERAKTVLMKRNHWTEDEAFRRLQRTAMHYRKPLVELARAILNGQRVELLEAERPRFLYTRRPAERTEPVSS